MAGVALFLGIDPGVNGGLVAVDHLGILLRVAKMPATERDILAVLLEWGSKGTARAVLEHVWSIPGQGGAFKFGRNVGHLQMALTAARIPFDQVLPRAWQKAMGIVYPAGSTDTEKKNITKRRAQQLFPADPITHAIADAVLLAEFARRRQWYDEHGKTLQDAEVEVGQEGRFTVAQIFGCGRTEVEAVGVALEAAATGARRDGAGSRSADRSDARGSRGRAGNEKQVDR